jgi:energy-coupling factor transporter ATP-binding protein EcfA2
MSLFELDDVSKVYRQGSNTIEALRHMNLRIEAGERVAIQGSTGGGKSTLLQLLGALDTPTSGSVRFDGRGSRNTLSKLVAIVCRPTVERAWVSTRSLLSGGRRHPVLAGHRSTRAAPPGPGLHIAPRCCRVAAQEPRPFEPLASGRSVADGGDGLVDLADRLHVLSSRPPRRDRERGGVCRRSRYDERIGENTALEEPATHATVIG